MANADLQLNACPRAIAKVRKERDLLPSHTIKKHIHQPMPKKQTNVNKQRLTIPWNTKTDNHYDRQDSIMP